MDVSLMYCVSKNIQNNLESSGNESKRLDEYNLLQRNMLDRSRSICCTRNSCSERSTLRIFDVILVILISLSVSCNIGYMTYVKHDVNGQIKHLSALISTCNCPIKGSENAMILPNKNEILPESSLVHENNNVNSSLERNNSDPMTALLIRSARSSGVRASEKSRIKSLDKQKRKHLRQQIKRELKKTKKTTAIGHFIAPTSFPRQYESGAVLAFNESINRDVGYRFWTLPEWIDRKSFNKVFHFDDKQGTVSVKNEGLYLVYAQVVYHDLTGRWSYGIYIGDKERVKCLATEQLRNLTDYDERSHGVYHQCYTAQVMYIRKFESVSLRCLYGMRTILTRPEFTFWGIIQL